MGERTEYHREYYRSHPEIRQQQRKYVRRWRAANKAWAHAKLSNPWLGTRTTTAQKLAYMKEYRRERRLWAAIDMMLSGFGIDTTGRDDNG